MDKKRTSQVKAIPTSKERVTDELDRIMLKSLKDLISDRSLSKHQKVLEQVYKYIIQGLDNDKKWSTKCEALKCEVEAHASKVELAIRLSGEDKIIIDSLKRELENAWDRIEQLQSASQYTEPFMEVDGNDCTTDRGDFNPFARSRKLQSEKEDLVQELENCRKQLGNSEIQWELEKQMLGADCEEQKLAAAGLEVELHKVLDGKSELQKAMNDLKCLLIKKDEELKIVKKQLKRAEGFTKFQKLKRPDQEKVFLDNERKTTEIRELKEELSSKDKLIAELTSESNGEMEKLIRLESEVNTMKNELSISEKFTMDKSVSTESSSEFDEGNERMCGKSAIKRNKVDKSFDDGPTKNCKDIGSEHTNAVNKVDKCVGTEPTKLKKQFESLKQKLKEVARQERNMKALQVNLIRGNKVLFNKLTAAQSCALKLQVELTKTKKVKDALDTQCHKYASEVEIQSMIIQQLETVRNNHVNDIGHLEGMLQNQKSEMIRHEHANQSERIKSLEEELSVLKSELEYAKRSYENESNLHTLVKEDMIQLKESVRLNSAEIWNIVNDLNAKNRRFHTHEDGSESSKNNYNELSRQLTQEHTDPVKVLKNKLDDAYTLLEQSIQDQQKLIQELEDSKQKECAMSVKLDIQEKALLQYDKDFTEQQKEYNIMKEFVKNELSHQASSSCEPASTAGLSAYHESSDSEDDVRDEGSTRTKSFLDDSKADCSFGDPSGSFDMSGSEYIAPITKDEMYDVEQYSSSNAKDFQEQTENFPLGAKQKKMRLKSGLDSSDSDNESQREPKNFPDGQVMGSKSNVSAEGGNQNLLKRIDLLETMLTAKSDEVIRKNVDGNRKDKLIGKLKKDIQTMEKGNDLLKYKRDLDKKEKALRDMEAKAKTYEARIRDHQVEEIRLNTDLQKLKTKREVTKFVVPRGTGRNMNFYATKR